MGPFRAPARSEHIATRDVTGIWCHFNETSRYANCADFVGSSRMTAVISSHRVHAKIGRLGGWYRGYSDFAIRQK